MPAPRAPSLPELQHAFAAVLRGADGLALSPWIAARSIAPVDRLRIYRHAGYAIHVDALATSFPAVRSLLGEACFDGIATRHAARQGSRHGNLQQYGADFATFLDQQPELSGWPWLGALARLEWLRQQVALAADVAAADGRLLASVNAPWRLRPCVRVLVSPFAVLELWRHALAPSDHGIDPAIAQSLLLWREGGQVAMREISPAQASFVHQLRQGATPALALAAAQDIDPAIHPESLLAPLLEHALFAAPTITEDCP